mmetsp:Transcript_37502/g.120723  ORF Transcript_37502/g.120723 Transcript_37502/m.120723 type:complete len:262 (+) Transcript_37502:540-1325(+)
MRPRPGSQHCTRHLRARTVRKLPVDQILPLPPPRIDHRRTELRDRGRRGLRRWGHDKLEVGDQGGLLVELASTGLQHKELTAPTASCLPRPGTTDRLRPSPCNGTSNSAFTSSTTGQARAHHPSTTQSAVDELLRVTQNRGSERRTAGLRRHHDLLLDLLLDLLREGDNDHRASRRVRRGANHVDLRDLRHNLRHDLPRARQQTAVALLGTLAPSTCKHLVSTTRSTGDEDDTCSGMCRNEAQATSITDLVDIKIDLSGQI